MKNGISLIILVITIIVIVILAGAVILSLSQNNPIINASEAAFKSSVKAFQSDFNLYLTKAYSDSAGQLDLNTVNATTSADVKAIVKSMSDTDAAKYTIENGKLKFIGDDPNEAQWAKDAGIEIKIISNGLVLWLEGSDFTNSPQTAIWVDRTENKINGTVKNFNFTTSSGSNGNGSVVFDGIDDYVDFGNVTKLHFTSTSSYTMEAIINPTAVGAWKTIMVKGRESGNWYGMWLYGSSATFGGSGNVNGPNLTNGVTYYITMVQDGASGKRLIYLNGAYNTQSSTVAYDNGGVFCIGGFTTPVLSEFFNGSMKTIRIYNRAFSSTDVLRNYITSK